MDSIGLIGGVMKWRDWYLILIAAACLVAALWVARALVGGVL